MRLTALRANNPIAVMAAYGLVRLLPGARLRWDDVHPELAFEGNVYETLAALLPERACAPENTLIDDPRDKNIGGVEGYRALAGKIPGDWLAALASETKEGLVATQLLLTGGRFKFISTACEAIAFLMRHDDIEAKLKEALIGPWRYDDRNVASWGWDANARIDAASSAKAVVNMVKYGVAGAYWLAWESLPLWPMLNGRTVGMEKGAWTYPTCAESLGSEGIRSLIIGAPRLGRNEATALGVVRWRSAMLTSGQYGRTLGWATSMRER